MRNIQKVWEFLNPSRTGGIYCWLHFFKGVNLGPGAFKYEYGNNHYFVYLKGQFEYRMCYLCFLFYFTASPIIENSFWKLHWTHWCHNSPKGIKFNSSNHGIPSTALLLHIRLLPETLFSLVLCLPFKSYCAVGAIGTNQPL